MPERYFADGHRLLAFASVEESWFYWHLVPGTTPDDWGVVFVDADMEGWHDGITGVRWMRFGDQLRLMVSVIQVR
ncbi:hypothetical protein Asp14428_68650 [Actinoplanes sp. NBRC 14428]|nr:hypothetical protein Asp14428_68650 [Actinoplanes sp. NBRC 14428]